MGCEENKCPRYQLRQSLETTCFHDPLALELVTISLA
jgi:hypothetical protein